jgi:ANTAR domain
VRRSRRTRSDHAELVCRTCLKSGTFRAQLETGNEAPVELAARGGVGAGLSARVRRASQSAIRDPVSVWCVSYNHWYAVSLDRSAASSPRPGERSSTPDTRGLRAAGPSLGEPGKRLSTEISSARRPFRAAVGWTVPEHLRSIVESDEHNELAQEFAQLGRDIHRTLDHSASMRRLVELSVKHIDGCDFASIILMRGAAVSTLASSDGNAARAEELQAELSEGPCLSSAGDDRQHLLFDVEGDTRWPRFAAAVAEQTTIRCVLAMPLIAHESAALNLFSVTAGGFSMEAVDQAAILASHASNLVALHIAENKAANLQTALQTSRDIGAAVGILMAHRHVTKDHAFVLLTEASQKLQRKLRDVADAVVDTGELPSGSPAAARQPDKN